MDELVSKENQDNNHSSDTNTMKDSKLLNSCWNHLGLPFSSICLASKVNAQVFHCQKCEHECNSKKYHVSLSQLDKPFDLERVNAKWPVLSEDVQERVSEVLSLTYEDNPKGFFRNHSNHFQLLFSKDLTNLDEQILDKLKKQQMLLQETFNKYSLLNEFSEIIMKSSYSFEEKQQKLMSLIIFVQEHQKEIDQEFIDLLTIYDNTKFILEIINKKNELSQVKYSIKRITK